VEFIKALFLLQASALAF